jgi:hypothetical protein
MKKTEKGIVLITTMLLLSFIIMIASLLIITGRNTLFLGTSYNYREQAQYAAESGLAIVQFAIYNNVSWNAADATGTLASSIYHPGNTQTDGSFNDLYLEQTRPYVFHGKLRNGECEFYVAFNNNSSAVPSTTLQDANNQDLKYCSYNNLNSSASSATYYNNSIINGTPSWHVFKTIPAKTCHIIVEGRSNGAKKYAEAIITLADTVTGLSSSMAANDININLTDANSSFTVNNNDDGASRIRSMGNINLNSSSGDTNPFQIANSGTSCTGKGAGTGKTKINSTTVTTGNQATYGITVDNTTDQTPFLKQAKLTWADAAGKYVNGTNFTSNVTTGIQGGTLVYRNSVGDPTHYNLFYYPQTLTAYNADTFATAYSASARPYTGSAATWKTGAGNPIITGDASKLTLQNNVADSWLGATGNYLVTVKGPMGITNSDTAVKDFSIGVFDWNSTTGTKFSPSVNNRAGVKLEGADAGIMTLDTGAVNTSGNIYISGELSGTGKVLSAGTLTFQGHSVLQAENNSGGLAMYARGTIQVDPVKGDLDDTSDVTNALEDAWSKIAGTGSGEFVTTYTKYTDLSKKILDATITGTYAGQSYTNKKLKDVLHDAAGLNYDDKTAQNLVDTLVQKSTYFGDNTGGTGGVAVDKCFDASTQKINGTGKGNYLSITAGSPGCSNNTANDPPWTYGSANTLSFGNKGNYGSGVKFSFPVGMNGGADFSGDAAAFIAAGGMIGTGYCSVGSAATIPSVMSAVTINYVAATGTGTVVFTYNGKSYGSSICNSGWGEGTYTAPTGNSGTIVMYQTSNNNFCSLVFNDTLLNGLIYTWEDLYGPNLQGGSFLVRGGVVAYGGNPAGGVPGSDAAHGKIRLSNAKSIQFTYDPAFMTVLLAANGCKTKRVYQGTF